MCYGASSNEQFVRQYMRNKTIFFKKWPSTGFLIPCHHLPRALVSHFVNFHGKPLLPAASSAFWVPVALTCDQASLYFRRLPWRLFACSRSLTHRITKNSGADPGEFSPSPPPPLFPSPLLSFFFSLSLKYWLVLLHYYKHPPPHHFKILDPRQEFHVNVTYRAPTS